jgi:hypothetical protein
MDLHLLAPTDPRSLALRAHRRIAMKPTEIAAKHLLEEAMADRDLDATVAAVLDYTQTLIDGCRELVAAAELDHVNHWLASHGAQPAQRWPVMYTLGQVYESLGDPFRAICAAHGARVQAEAAGATEGQARCDQLLVSLVPAH